MLLMSQGLGCGKRDSVFQGLWETRSVFQPKAEGVGSLWAGPQGRCSLGSCGKREAFSMGTGAVHGLSMPEQPGARGPGRRNPQIRRFWAALPAAELQEFFNYFLHIKMHPRNLAQIPEGSCTDSREGVSESCTDSRFGLAQIPVDVPPFPQPGILETPASSPSLNLAQIPVFKEFQ